MSQKVLVKTTLDGELLKMFKKIKETYGFKTDAATIRFCIAHEHKQLFGTKQKYLNNNKKNKMKQKTEDNK